MQEHDLLILGAGWTATFLIPLLRARNLSFAATTRDGRTVAGAKTIPWSFDPDASSSSDQFSALPLAKTVLITFPLTGKGQSKLLLEGYMKAHRGKDSKTGFIQLGSTGIWQIPQSSHWTDRRSPYNNTNARAIAEDELLSTGHGSVLNLSGLWGGPRDPRDWVDRVARSKEDVKNKKSVHLIHGEDVARAVVAVSEKWEAARGQRWMLTDGFVYDWWALFAGWGDGKEDETDPKREVSKQAQWTYELMREEGVKALPRSMETLGRCYDSREFWGTFGLAPLKARI